MRLNSKPAAIIIADTHLTEFTVEQNISVFSQVFAICDQLQVTDVIHLGDVFTSRKGQLEIVLLTWKRILDMAELKGIKITAIAGNHDKQDYTSESSYLEVFEKHPAFNLIKGAYSMDYVGNMRLHFIPYFDEQLTYPKYLQLLDFKPQSVNILLTHCAINGLTWGNGVPETEAVERSLMSMFSLVLVGHYHNRQAFDNVLYIGSTDPRNFGEDNDKGVFVLNTDGTYRFINLEFKKYNTVDIENPTLKDINGIKEMAKADNLRLNISGEVPSEIRAFISSLKGVKAVFKDNFNVATTVDMTITSDNILEHFEYWCFKNEVKDNKLGLEILTEKLKTNVEN